MFTFKSLALGHADDVNHLVLVEDLTHGQGLLEVLARPVDLLRNGASVELDLHEMRLLLSLLQQLHLRVAEDSDHLAVLLHALQVFLDFAFSSLVLPLLAGLCERLLLRLMPVRPSKGMEGKVQTRGQHSSLNFRSASGVTSHV